MTRRAAFTLVELLVVASIFAALFGLVLAGARPSTTAQIKQAANSLASLLLVTQSHAIGNIAGAALILESSGTACLSLANADMAPLIEGTATGMPPSTLATTTADIAIDAGSLNADVADLTQGYKVQFYDLGPPAEPPSMWMAFSGTSRVSFRTANGQTADNTIWPKSASGSFAFRIARYPSVAETAARFQEAAAIDLRFSGVGDDPLTTWGGLANKGAIAIVYDGMGSVDALMQQVTSPAAARTVQPVDPMSPAYFLVASRSDIDAGTSLASDKALWVSIHPQTGRVSISANVPQTGTNATAVRAARAKARAGIALGK
jgi:type II secretory pathway pseudopilin PulG